MIVAVGRSLRGSALACAAVILLCAAAPPPEKKPAPAKKPTGKVEVTVEFKGQGTIQSCTLYLKEQRVDLASGAATHLFENVSTARHAVTADAMIGADLAGAKRYVGVKVVNVAANRTTKATLSLEEAGSMEDYCRRCHPDANQLTEADQTARDLHYSGKPLEKKHLAQVDKYNARSEQLRKEGQPYNLPIILEKRTVVEGGKTIERLFYTCESCHTLHWTRDEEKYTRALFRRKGNLCRGCHP